MNYKPFDQNKWAAGDPIQFRNGQTDMELFYSAIRASSGNYPPLISVDSSGTHRFHLSDGKLSPEDNGNGFDIVMAPKKVTYYFVSCRNEWGRYPSQMTTVEADADNIAREWAKEHRMSGIQKHTIEIEE